MRLAVSRWWPSDAAASAWQDEQGAPLERRLREIAAALIVFAEQTLRDAALSAHAHHIQRKAELQDAWRKQQVEEERRRREHQARIEEARVKHLLSHARALHQAAQIREYVSSIRTLNAQAPDPMAQEELEAWAAWALAQADRIDPVVSGAYRTRPAEPVGQFVNLNPGDAAASCLLFRLRTCLTKAMHGAIDGMKTPMW